LWPSPACSRASHHGPIAQPGIRSRSSSASRAAPAAAGGRGASARSAKKQKSFSSKGLLRCLRSRLASACSHASWAVLSSAAWSASRRLRWPLSIAWMM
jgi:hypothetical protein